MLKSNVKRRISIGKVCRTCLTERGNLRNVFSTNISSMIEACAAVQVRPKDGLPSNICISCFHLIAKFYTFKKKVERNHKLLKNQLRNTEKDILDIALTQAQIENEPMQDEPTREELDKQEESSSEEDIPLSEVVKLSKNKEKVEQNDIKTSLISDDFLENIINNSAAIGVQLLSDGPPPLIPIETTNKVETSLLESEVNLPEDTPPLVPIKPIVNPESVITIIKNDIKLTCSFCEEQFTSIDSLKNHKLTNCTNSSLQCNICKKVFEERKKLIGHLKGHMVVKDHCCKICDKRYPNPSTFKVHMRTHTGERPFRCNVCGKGFVRWAGVVGHMKTHTSVKPYTCPTCGKGFKISSNLERHKVLHTGILPYCCNYCGKTFSQSDNLQLHIRTYHTNERPYLCNECGKGFVSSTRLSRHMWVHSGYKPYQCLSCPKSYSNCNDLKNHERTHSGTVREEDKPYACNVCSMRFFHPCRLSKHTKTHERPFPCKFCPKSFSDENLLQRHVIHKHDGSEVAQSAQNEGENVQQEIQYPFTEVLDGKKENLFLQYDG